MKRLTIILILLFSTVILNAQNDEVYSEHNDEIETADTSKTYRRVFGINAYPALGIFGGSRTPNVKIFVQYKYQMKNINLKGSLNYSDFFKEDYSYFIGIIPERVTTDSGTVVLDSALFRHHRNSSFSYDVRLGIDAKLNQRNVSLFLGTDLVFGFHKTTETYQFSRKSYMENKPLLLSFYFNEIDKEGFRNVSYLKMGLDFTFGLDVKLSEKILITLQYTPELVYYYNVKENKNDPHDIYTDKIKNSFQFIPYFVDVILSVRF